MDQSPPPPGWYPDPDEPTTERWWDGQGWGPGRPATATDTGEPLRSKGLDAVCWTATWVALLAIACFFSFSLALSNGDDGRQSSLVLSAVISALYLIALLPIYLWAAKRQYRLGQQLVVSVAAVVFPLFLYALSSTLGLWPEAHFNQRTGYYDYGAKPLAFLLLSLASAAVAAWGVWRLRAGLAAGILLNALLSALALLLIIAGLAKWEESYWVAIWDNWGILLPLALSLALAAAALWLEPRQRHIATWIWPTVWQMALVVIIALGDSEIISLLVLIAFTLASGALALILRRAGLLAATAVGALVSQLWLFSLLDISSLLAAALALPLSLLLLFAGFWFWRHGQRLRQALPTPLAQLHSGGDEATLW